MSNDGLGSRLEDLFSDDIPDPEPKEDLTAGEPKEAAAYPTDHRDLGALRDAVAPDAALEPQHAADGQGAAVTDALAHQVSTGEAPLKAPLGEPTGSPLERLPTKAPDGSAFAEAEQAGSLPPAAEVTGLAGPSMVEQVRASILTFLLASVAVGGTLALLVQVVQSPNRLGRLLAMVAASATILTVVAVVQWLSARAQRQAIETLRDQNYALSRAQTASEDRQAELQRAKAALESRAVHFELGLEVARVAALGLSQRELAARIAGLIHRQLGLFRVRLLRLDDLGNQVELLGAAGAGVDGASVESFGASVAEFWLLRACVSTGRPAVADDLAPAEGRLALPADLWQTDVQPQSAAALPLVAHNQWQGVLVVESDLPAAFRRQDVASLMVVVDQTATAIASARLSDELQDRLAQMAALQRYYVRDAWEEFLLVRQRTAFEYDRPGASVQDDELGPEVQRVLTEPQLAIPNPGEISTGSAVVAPISLHDQVIGVLGLHEEQDRSFSDEEIGILRAVSEQIGLMLDNARLFEQARSSAARERTVREITAKMRENLDVDTVLRVAAEQMRGALGLREVTIELYPPKDGGNADQDDGAV